MLRFARRLVVPLAGSAATVLLAAAVNADASASPSHAGSSMPQGHPPIADTAVSHGSVAKSAAAAGCPIDHSRLPSGASNPHATAPIAPAASAPSSTPPSECPVPHASPAPASACPVDHGAASPPPSASRAGRGTVYNVYAQPIDPTNQMPAVPAQHAAPGQASALPTARVQSSIPKGGTDSTWLYPSPQMFWNALVRKNKADGVAEGDIEMVVAIHNEMNERTWRALVQWEGLHASEHLPGEPSLRRFMGKPYELSLKAKVKQFFGYGLPFDRHDWFVDRGGREVHYIIDYYFNPDPKANVADIGAGLLEPTHTKGIHVDVRPAIEDVSSVLDRLRLLPGRLMAGLARPRWRAEGLDPASRPLEAAAFALSAPSAPPAASHGSSAAAAATAPPPLTAVAPATPTDATAASDDDVQRAHVRCGHLLEKLKNAPDDAARSAAQVTLNYCMGNVLCPSEAARFMTILERNSNMEGVVGDVASAEEEKAFGDMTRCVVTRIQKPTRVPA